MPPCPAPTAPCITPVRISALPFDIVTPGEYCLAVGLVYTQASGAAIRIRASDVTLRGNNQRLLLQEPGASGIAIFPPGDVPPLEPPLNQIRIENLVVEYAEPNEVATSAGVSVALARNVTLDNVTVLNAYYGVLANGVVALRVAHSLFENQHAGEQFAGANLRINDSDSVRIEHSTLRNASENFFDAGVRIGTADVVLAPGRSRDVTLSDLHLLNADLFMREVDGLLIERVVAQVDDPTYTFGLLQLGTGGAVDVNLPGAVNSALVRDSSFANPRADAAPGATGVFLVNGSEILLENVLIRQGGTSDAEPTSVAANIVLAIGSALPTDAGPVAVTNLRIIDSVLSGPCSWGIVAARNPLFPDAPFHSGLVLRDSQVSNALFDTVYLDGVVASVLRDNEISSAGRNGITLLNSGDLTLYENDIGLADTAAILLSAQSQVNIVKRNVVHEAGVGIQNDGELNAVAENEAFQTAVPYAGDVPAQVAQGQPLVAGANLFALFGPAITAADRQPAARAVAARAVAARGAPQRNRR